MGQAPQEKGVEAARRRNPSLPLGKPVLYSVSVPELRMRRTTGQRGGCVAERFVPLFVGEEWARSVCYHPCHRLYVGTDWGASTIPVHSPPSDAHLTLTVDFVLRSSRMATNIS
jgi:hypothetical protein